jgi:hypothetical protein
MDDHAMMLFTSASFINYICLIPPRDAQILRLVGRSETQYDIYIKKNVFVFIIQIRYHFHTTPLTQTSLDQSDLR